MREIKFRAWDKEEKSLITGDDNQGSIFGEEGGYFDLREEPNRYELMQFTGLKDKNGKEIYEGDILKWQDFDFDYEKQSGQVVFEPYVFMVKMGNNHDNYQDLHRVEVEGDNTIEVIGNIYENPELLK